MQEVNLLKCSVEKIRLSVPFWNSGVIFEALRKIRATWKVYAGKMSEPEVYDLLRKESALRSELRRRLRKAGIAKSDTHRREEAIIESIKESAFKW